MPIEYKIEAKINLVTSRAWGQLTGEEIIAHELSLSKDSKFNSSCNQLVDFTQVTDIKITAEEIQKIATIGPWGRKSHRAAAMPSDLLFGLTRTYEVYNEMQGEGSALMVFRTIHEAREWLEENAGREDG